MTTDTTERAGEVSTFALDVYWASGRAGDASIAAHVERCDRCKAYLAHLDTLYARLPVPRPPLRSGADRRPWWPGAMAGGLAVAAAVALFAIARARTPASGAYVGAKGTPAAQVLLRRGQETRVWDGRAALRPGDALALRVSCEEWKRIAVAVPGPQGWARVSDALCPASDAPLPFTLQVDGEPGDEQLALVLTQRSIDDGALERAIEENRRAADAWTIRFVLPKQTETDR
jgi:hypothetical protein